MNAATLSVPDIDALIKQLTEARAGIAHLCRYGEDAVWRPAIKAAAVLTLAIDTLTLAESSAEMHELKTVFHPASEEGQALREGETK